MSGRAPESFWDRLMRRLDRADDEKDGVDESVISFHLLFTVPLLLMLLMLIETEQDQAPARTQHARAFFERACWLFGIGERVKQHHRIVGSGLERQRVNVCHQRRDVREAR